MRKKSEVTRAIVSEVAAAYVIGYIITAAIFFTLGSYIYG